MKTCSGGSSVMSFLRATTWDPKARRHVCTLPVGGGEVFEIEFEALVKSVDTFAQAPEILVRC